jgi:catechol 2,3-dioxygenase-like lactoylglutathione lyase family enzyme
MSSDSARSGPDEIVGLHHVKLPVTDLTRSRAWYERVFDLEPKVEFEDDDGVVRGVSYLPKGGFTLALRENITPARAMAGFDPFAILVETRQDLDAWARHLDDLAVERTPVAMGAMGWLFAFNDPDGLQLKLYTAEEHEEQRPGRRRVAK